MRLSARLLTMFFALLIIGVAGASADTLLYTLTGGPITASFELPVNPTLLGHIDGFGFAVVPTDLIINGVASSDFLMFYNGDPSAGGAFAAFACTSCGPDLNLGGPQLYSGPEASPTMLMLNGVEVVDADTGAFAGTVTTTPVSATPTPEPSSLALAALGSVLLLACGRFLKPSNRLSAPVA